MFKCIKKTAAVFIAAAAILISVPQVSGLFVINSYAADSKWDSSWSSAGTAKFAVDKSTYYGSSGYSIKIQNKDFDCSCVRRKFKLKKNTDYRVSVMAKYSGCSIASDAQMASGAYIGQAWSYNISDNQTGSEWKELTYEFNTGSKADEFTGIELIKGNSKELLYDIALYNGLWNSKCKGTAWFSDFRIEESAGRKTNEWDVLAVMFKNVNAPVNYGGKSFTYKNSFSNSDVNYIKNIINNLYTSIPLLSEDLWKIGSIDFYASDIVVNNLGNYGSDYCVDPYDKKVSKELNKYIAAAKKESGKDYEQIIIISPIRDIAQSWAGLGGTEYENINFCQVNYIPGSREYDNGGFSDAVFVHEMIHCVERISKIIDPKKTIDSHCTDESFHTKNGWVEWGSWYADYLRRETKDGKGINPKAFEVNTSESWKVVLGSKRTSPNKKSVSSLTISSIKDMTFSGTAKKPNVTVKDGNKTLVKGTDYKLTYLNNVNIGLGAVVVEGIGKYAGKRAVTFKINPSKTELSVKKTGSTYNLSWNSIKGAKKYEIYYSADSGKTFKRLYTADGNTTGVSVNLDSKKKYIFKIRSYGTIYPQKFYSAFSASIKV